MAIKRLNPYLMFNGTANQAIQLYQSALGATIEGSMGIMRFGDVPAEVPTSPEDKNRVMHAELHVGDGVFMVSDGRSSDPVGSAGNIQVTLTFDDVEDMTRKFDALAAGGQVELPVHDAFWGDKFGMLTDAYGIHWMFSCPAQKR